MLFHKKNKYKMNIDTANAALQNIFAACDQKPNSTPFDTILLRQEANTKSCMIAKHLSELFILILFGLPLLFKHSQVSISTNTPNMVFSVENHYIEDSKLFLDLSSGSVDADRCYATTADGNRYLPISYNKSGNILVFPYDNKELNIFIYDTMDNYMQLVLTPTK